MSEDNRSSKRRRVESDNYYDPNEKYVWTKLTFSIDIVSDEETDKLFIKTYGDGAEIIDADPEYDYQSTMGYDEYSDLIKKVVTEKLYEKFKSDDLEDTIEIKSGSGSESESDEDDKWNRTRYPKIGDMVSVSYCPASQKYIEHYAEQAFTGEVFFVDQDRDDFFMLNVEVGKLEDSQISIEYRVQSFKREGCHYFGMTAGYDGYYQFV